MAFAVQGLDSFPARHTNRLNARSLKHRNSPTFNRYATYNGSTRIGPRP